MTHSNGTYLQGICCAERLLTKFIGEGQEPTEQFKKMITRNEVPSYYYAGKNYCDGFYDYIHYYIDNKDLINKYLKELINET